MDKQQKLDVIKDLVAQGKAASLMRGSDIYNIKSGVVPSGIYSLDYALGGGFLKSKVTHLYGESSHGKSSTMLQTIAYNQKRDSNFMSAVINLEGYWDPDNMHYFQQFGVDMERLFIINSPDHEEALDVAVSLVRSRVLDLLIVDSIAALIPPAEEQKSFGDNEKTAIRASMVERLMRKLAANLQIRYNDQTKQPEPNPCAVVILNQMRTGMTRYTSSRDPASAKALKFFTSCTIRVHSYGKEAVLNYKFNKQILDTVGYTSQASLFSNDGQVGKVISYTIDKNRFMGKEGLTVKVPFYGIELLYPAVTGFWSFGFDIIGSLLSTAIDLNIIQHKGAWYVIGEQTIQGEINVLKEIRINDEFRNDLVEKVECVLYEGKVYKREKPTVREKESKRAKDATNKAKRSRKEKG